MDAQMKQGLQRPEQVFKKLRQDDAIIAQGGKSSILKGQADWPVVGAIVAALPMSIIIAAVVSLASKPPSKEHPARCLA